MGRIDLPVTVIETHPKHTTASEYNVVSEFCVVSEFYVTSEFYVPSDFYVTLNTQLRNPLPPESRVTPAQVSTNQPYR